MKGIWVVCLFFLQVNGGSIKGTNRCINKIKYYRDLINNGNAAALNWTYPTRNTYFEGYDTSYSNYYGTFDFIIVGGGSAGSVLATRLSEQPSWRILLLEAGGDETDLSLMPRMFLQNLRTNRNWGYRTVPQKEGCRGAINHQCDYPRGKSLGGSSGNNAMFFIRGNRGDFSDWISATRSYKWSYEKVLPYFKKLETAKLHIKVDSNYRGKDGPIYCTNPTPTDQYGISKHVLQANKELDLDVLDFNGAVQLGAAEMQSSIKYGRRASTNQAYLQPALNKKTNNLVVLKQALAVKLLFDENYVEGVEFLYKRKTFYALHRKETILSAGSINTPQLLMLSGVGQQKALDLLKIPVVADLPVGQNLEDHPALMLTASTNLVVPPFDTDKLIKEYLQGKGLLTSMPVQSISYFSSDRTGKITDVELLYTAPGPYNSGALTQKSYNMNPAVLRLAFPPTKNFTIVSYLVLLHPKSRGTVTLKTSDALDFPLIDPNYFTDPTEYDLAKYYDSIKFLKKLYETDAMKAINAKLHEPPIPECLLLKADLRRYWYCVIKYMASTLYHPVATCKMGLDPQTSVVDENFKIHGLEGIRIIDASVIPTSTSGHPNAVVIMMAERMSDIIHEEYAS